MKPFSIIGLKFLNKNGKLSRTYEYLMTEELSNKFYSTYKDSIGDNSYLILNENTYNYQNSRVVVCYWHKAKAKNELYPELLYLNDFYEAMPVEIKSRCYDGSTPFDEKEKDMDLEKRNRKESKKMFENVMKNFEFGKCGENVKMSVYGPAFKDNEGNYIAFNGDEAMDVTGMTFDFDCFYKMPVAQDDVEIGDYVYHLNDPVKVVDVTERGSLVCIRLFSHEEVTVVPIKNMFGFNFFTKLINFGEGLFGANTIDKSNPFGSMLPLFLMSKGGKSDNLMMAMMMSQGNLDFKSNPLMLMALMGENNSEMLPLFMMYKIASNHECKCGECNVSDSID